MSVLRNTRCLAMGVAMGLAGMVLGGGWVRARAHASALPSVQVGAGRKNEAGRGRRLLDEMVAALGGEAWLNRQTWIFEGRTATFYKGQPDEGAPQFEEYYRVHPFGERVVMISHFGAIIATDHRDVADVWTSDNGYEVTYKGTTVLPATEVAEYQRWRRHSLEVVVEEWLKQPGAAVTDEGSKMVELDQSTHLPLSVSFQWRDPLYKDWNTEVQEFADYHAIQGIMTPYSIITMHNGDMTGERFLTRAAYNVKLPAELFDPSRPLEKKGK
jgi:hypothetical protein